MKSLAIAAAIAATFALAACDKVPEQPAAEAPAAVEAPVVVEAPAVVETPAVEAEPEAPVVSIEIPADTMLPGTDMTVEQAMETVQAQSDNMTVEQKQAAVAEARTQAEAAAKAAGMTDEQVKQAGDAAEQAAKTMFGL